MPSTGWTISANANGVTSEVIGTGTETGLAYIDIKISGTPTSNGTVFINFEGSPQVVAANGQTWTNSAYFKLAAGATTNASVIRGLAGRTPLGVGVSGQGTQPSFTLSSSALNTQRQSATFTFTDATVERVLPYCGVAYTNGNPIDLTLRIAAPQLEQGAFPTSYIPTTDAAATRSADSAVVTPISSFYNQAEGTLFAEFSSALPTAGVGAAFSDGTSNNQLLFTASSTGVPRWAVRSTNGADINLGSAVTANEVRALIGAYSAGQAIAARSGNLSSTASIDLPVGINTLRIGGATLNGRIRKLAYWPRRLSNTLLQQLTT
jgi:hypothetical protein